MNFSTYRFTLDLHKHQSQMSIAVFQYDTAVRLSIGITDGGVPYHLEDGCIAVLYGKKANGDPIVHNCMIEENTRIIYDFNKETANELGVVDCQIGFYKDGAEILSAPKFIIVVGEKVANDTEVYDAGDGAFEEQFSALDNLFVNESARVLAEQGRVQAEQGRVEAEQGRVEAEAKRVKAEKERGKLTSELDNKVDKTSSASKLYGTNSVGSQVQYTVSNSPTGPYVVQRTNDGDVITPATPTHKNGATSKSFVEGLVNPLEERISDLENLTLTYTEDSKTAYEKTVPTGVGKYALIKSVGGASKIGPAEGQKNLINPYEIGIYDSSTGNGLYSFVNADGSITFPMSESTGLMACFDFGSWNLGKGKFYYFYEGDINLFIMPDYEENDVLSAEFHLPWDEEAGCYYDVDFTFKLMIYKYGESDRCELTEAPAGTVFEPYVVTYQHAKLDRIESIGANLIPFPYHYTDREINGVTFTINNDGGIKVKGTATSAVTFFLTPSSKLEISTGKTVTVSGGVATTDKMGRIVVNARRIRVDGNDDSWIESPSNRATGTLMEGERLSYVALYIAKGLTVDATVYPMLNYGSAAPYKPYRTEPIDTITIPESVKALDGYGREGSYIKCDDGVWTLGVTKDKNLSPLVTPIITDITNLFTEDNAIEVEQGGTLRFVNEHKLAVPNTIAYVTRKE